MMGRILCPSMTCRHACLTGRDRLGRTFRCPRCGSRLPASGTTGRLPETADRPASPATPWDAERPPLGRTLGVVRPTILGRFAVHSRLWRSGPFSVFRADDLGRGFEVELTVCDSGEPEDADPFRVALGRLARLDHPCVESVLETIASSDQLVVIRRPSVGPTLADLLTGGTLSVERAVEVVQSLADGLHHAHGLGVIHGQVHAASVSVDPGGQPCLVGFRLPGVSYGAANGLAAAASTPPEREINGHATPTAAWDQYGLGVLLYTALCGLPPFVGPIDRVLDDVRRAEPPRLRVFRPNLPRGLELACLRAIAKNPDARFPSCAAFAASLEPWSEIRPNAVCPDPLDARPLSLGRSLLLSLRRPAAALGLFLA